jgi:dihydropteroate synthase
MELGLGPFEYDVGGRALVVGVLRGGDGAECLPVEALRSEAERLVTAGADVVDAGDPSTWLPPDSIQSRGDLVRLADVLVTLRDDIGVPVAVATARLDVLRAILAAGVDVAIDPTGCLAADYVQSVAESRASVVVTPPPNVLAAASGPESVSMIEATLRTGAERAHVAGIPQRRILVDSGAERAPTAAGAVALLGATRRLAALGYPVQFTVPRRFALAAPVYHALVAPAVECDDETRPADTAAHSAAGALALAICTGAALVRVDDVREARRVADVVAAIRQARADP